MADASETESDQQPQSNAPGSANVDAQGDVNVGGDVVGRDKVTTEITAGGHVIQAAPGATVIVGATPASTSTDEAPTPMDNVLLVTATKIEARMVMEVFSTLRGAGWHRNYVGNKTYFSLSSSVGGVNLHMVQSEMGSTSPGGALITIRNAIDSLSPIAVIMVGIAFGVNRSRQMPGDILVSKQILAYELQKVVHGSEPIPRGDRVMSSTRLLDRFRSGDLDWFGAKVHFGLVLSGEKLVADEAFRNRLVDLEPEAIGGEMEGAGLYVACNDAKVDWILVKGVCDWADGCKSDDYQGLAARNASEFVLHVIKQGGLNEHVLRRIFDTIMSWLRQGQ